MSGIAIESASSIEENVSRDDDQTVSLEPVAQLRQAEKLQTIGRFAAGIAHEINTPAQYIRDNMRFLGEAFDRLHTLLAACLQLPAAAGDQAMSGRLVENLAAAAAQADVPFLLREVPAAIDQSLEGIELVTRILHSVQEFAYPNGPREEAVDLNRAVETAVTICRSQWKHVADVATDFDWHLPAVACRTDDVQQVLINLLINATQAIEEKASQEKLGGSHKTPLSPGGRGVGGEGAATPKGTITIRTSRRGDWVEIGVEDTGTGIPEDIRPRVFGRFFTTKQPGHGTGQGLAIARAIVVGKYGGTIDFTSQLGRGTTFVVRLPIHSKFMGSENHGDEETDPVC